MPKPAPVKKSYDRIRKWLESHEQGRNTLVSIRPPASDKAIADFEKAMKAKLPNDLKELYQLLDGQDEDLLSEQIEAGLFPSGENGDLAHLFLPLKTARQHSKGGMPGYKPGWLAFGSNFGGDNYVIDLSTDDPKKRGRVLQFNHEYGGARVAAKSLAAFLQEIADGLDDESIIFDEDAGLSYVEGIDWEEEKLEYDPKALEE